MEWNIHRDGYFHCTFNGHFFELGEMGGGKYVLKHWKPVCISSTWYDVYSIYEGKALAERLATE